LIEHASEEALQFELKLWALQRIKTMRKAWDEGDYQALFEVIGKSEVTTIDDGVNFDPDSLERENDQASEGCDPAEAVLLADRSGNAIKIPYIFNQLNRKLARWAFRACTSADLKLPSFALADDGVLIEHRGKVLSASDWIPGVPHPGLCSDHTQGQPELVGKVSLLRGSRARPFRRQPRHPDQEPALLQMLGRLHERGDSGRAWPAYPHARGGLGS
jgi:hypothetical protein